MGEENAGKRSKAVNEAKYSEKNTSVANVVTDRSTLVAILEKVGQAVRLVLKLYGSLIAKAKRLYGLAKHRTRRAEAKSSVSQPGALGVISSGTGHAGAEANSSKAVTVGRVYANASGRVSEVYVSTRKVNDTNLGVCSEELQSVAKIEGVDASDKLDVNNNVVEILKGRTAGPTTADEVETRGSVRAAITGRISSVAGTKFVSSLNHVVNEAVKYAMSMLAGVLGVYRISNGEMSENEVFGSEGVRSVAGRVRDTAIGVGYNQDRPTEEFRDVSEARVGQSGIEFLNSAREGTGRVKAVGDLVRDRNERVPGTAEMPGALVQCGQSALSFESCRAPARRDRCSCRHRGVFRYSVRASFRRKPRGPA